MNNGFINSYCTGYKHYSKNFNLCRININKIIPLVDTIPGNLF